MNSLNGVKSLGGGGVVGGRNVNVGLLTCKLEVKVLAAYALDGNALNGNKHTVGTGELSSLKVSCSYISLGDVNGGNRLNGGVSNLNGGNILKLRVAVVEILSTGCLNSNTDLNTGHLLLSEVVEVVTTLVLKILKVYTVDLRAGLLRDDCRNNTLNGEDCALFSVCIVVKGGSLELRNSKAEAAFLLLACLILDGVGESVAEYGLAGCGNVYNVESAILAVSEGDRSVVNSPGDCEGLFVDYNVLCNLVVNGSSAESLVGELDPVVSCLKILVNYGLVVAVVAAVLAAVLAAVVNGGLKKATSGEYGERKSKNKEKG